RGQGEAPGREAGMRQDRIRRIPDLSGEIEDVDVDLSRAVSKTASPPDAPFDRGELSEQVLRGAGPADLGRAGPRGRLVRIGDRLGFVERRDTHDGREPRDLSKRRSEMVTAIAEVGAETEEDPPRPRRDVSPHYS